MSKNVPVLTATTRPRSTASAASSTFLVPRMFTASKSARFWLAPPNSAAQWMAESAPRAARTTASASVTSPVTTSTPSAVSGCGIRGLPGQGADVVAPLREQLADVGAGQPGGAGHQDRLGHAEACTAGSGMALSTWSAV